MTAVVPEGQACAVSEQDWARAVSLLDGAAKICLACHVRPDGDALGSMLAVGLALTARNARVIASFGDEPFRLPPALRFLPGTELLSPPGRYPASPGLMVTFDVAAADRLGALAGPAARAGQLIVLDHHASNPRFGTVNLIDPGAAATAVLAAALVGRLGVPLTPQIAAGLYTGLVTDTGSFRFNVTPAVHELAARLLRTGLEPEPIARGLWDGEPFGSLRLLSAALARAVLEPAAAGGRGLTWTTVTMQDRAGLGYETAETVIEMLRRRAEAEVAVVFKESDDGWWHASVRSKGAVDVARAAAALGGGGHAAAAGFSTREPAPAVLARLRPLLACPAAAAGR